MWVLGETEILPPALQDYPQIIKLLVVRVEATGTELFPVDCSRLLGWSLSVQKRSSTMTIQTEEEINLVTYSTVHDYIDYAVV